MSRVRVEDLYRRLPAHLRELDEQRGGAVLGLLAIVAEQADRVGAQVDELADAWFVETCPDWAVPYLADLLGVPLTHDVAVDDDTTALLSQRALVANTIRYRRRKGTAAVLESLAFDVTGWRTVAVEEFERLVTTQHLAHPRTHLPATVDLRAGSDLEPGAEPFAARAHTVDVHGVALPTPVRRPVRNTPVVTLHSYRVDGLLVPLATAREAGTAGRYRADPLDRDLPWVNPPVHDPGVTVRTTEDEVPAPLRRRRLREQLDARRSAAASGLPDPAPRWLTRPPFEVWLVPTAGDDAVRVDPAALEVCCLDPWKPPHASRVRVDPVTGRLVLPDPQPHRVLVTAAPGGVPGVGAGPAARPSTRDELTAAGVTWQRGVSRDLPAVAGELVASLDDAVAEWNAQPAGTVGVIALMDDHRHDVALAGATRIRVREGSRLTIVAAGWPELPVPGAAPGVVGRRPGVVTPERLRPAVVGDVEVRGEAPASSPDPGWLTLDGLLLSGTVTVVGTVAQQLGRLRLRHCTQLSGGVAATGNRRLLSVQAQRCLLGPVALPASVSDVEVTASVLDGDGAAGLTAPGAAARLDRVTVLGPVAVRALEAEDCLLAGQVSVQVKQQGCVRYSYLAPGSSTPRQYRCLSAPVPTFVSTQRGHRAYAVLADRAGAALRTASQVGDEVGAYAVTATTRREANAVIALTEYVRVGVTAGVRRVLTGS